jgi:superfamily II DNA or RNA helicase
MLKPGIYEQLINELLRRDLLSFNRVDTTKIQKDEIPQILSQYVGEILEKVLYTMKEEKIGIDTQIGLVNKIVKLVSNESPNHHLQDYRIDEPLEKLLSIINLTNSGNAEPEPLPRPMTSISRSSLFTASEDEPKMVDELKKEILSSDRIDILVSFIKFSGIRHLIGPLKEFTERGGKLRIITTSYMGATDPKAVFRLSQLENTSIKISYDTKRTRLHAKAYIFYRETGFSTAYVGSSNLSDAAISSGLEWNVKLTKKDLPGTISKIEATFESYWNSTEFELYGEEKHKQLAEAIKTERSRGDSTNADFFFDIKPYPFQQEILDKLRAEREFLGKNRNLVVAATGTGKTVISAFDYKRFCDLNKGKTNRLLFIAHRKDILDQSLKTFRAVLRNYNFGTCMHGEDKPDSFDHLFVSIQSFNSQKLFEKTSQDYYDFIIMDEFHHASAPSYSDVLSHYHPKILLALTATPERMDGIDISSYFDYRISAEIRLPEAINRKLLSPFEYFGITDSVDLSQVAWKQGGYDTNALTDLYAENANTANERALLIIEKLNEYLSDMESIKGIGFCVSVKHAQFMSDFFNRMDIPAAYLTGDNSREERDTTKNLLTQGKIKFIFTVDLYNEGVDIPEINTLLFLRPTQSLTVFLQQLGRGLRLSDGKECLTVLDFVGQANKKYNFEEKFAALVSKRHVSIQKQVEEGFVNLPRGCFIEFERKAQDYILENIKRSFSVRSGLKERIASFENDTSLKLTLENFLSYYHLEPLDIYSKNSFSRLCADAGVVKDFSEEYEKIFLNALKRLSGMDSHSMILQILDIMKDLDHYDFTSLSEKEIRMMEMLHYTIWGKTLSTSGFRDFRESFMRVRRCEPVFDEIIALLEYNLTRIDFVEKPVDLGFECPLNLYSNYTKDQILLAMDFKTPGDVREGVKYLPEKEIDLLFVTLNKSEKDFTPSTMYEDYAISDRLFHWQSQSTTSESSNTGVRYINHEGTGNRILLFVRDFKKTIAGNGSPYTFLGSVKYVKHEGTNPMSIVWELETPIPAKYLRTMEKLVPA